MNVPKQPHHGLTLIYPLPRTLLWLILLYQPPSNIPQFLNIRLGDTGSLKKHIRPLTRAMVRRIEEEKGLQKTLFLWRVTY